MKRRIFYLLLIATAMVSCTEWLGGKKGGSITSKEGDLSLAWDSITLHEKFVPEGYEPEEVSLDIDICIDVPSGDTPVDSLVDSNLCSLCFVYDSLSVEEGLDVFVDSIKVAFSKEMSQFYEKDDEFSFRYKHCFTMKGERMPASRNGVVAYRFTSYAYEGGAHGMTLTYGLNMDSKSGKVLQVSDVFADEASVLRLMQGQLLVDNGCETVEQLREKTGILMLGDLYVSDNNFLLLDDGVLFTFNQYDIAPYSSGVISVKLSYQQLKGCLKL